MAQAAIRRLSAGRIVAAQYDFAVHGGAVGTIGLGVNLQIGEIVVRSFAEVLTAVTGTSATVAVQSNAADDVIAAAAISGAPWSTTGFKAGVSDGAVGNFKKMTAAREVSVVIGTAAVTAGKFNVFLEVWSNSVA